MFMWMCIVSEMVWCTSFLQGTRRKIIHFVCICRILRYSQPVKICVMRKMTHCLSRRRVCVILLMLLADFWRLRISQCPKPHTKETIFLRVPCTLIKNRSIYFSPDTAATPISLYPKQTAFYLQSSATTWLITLPSAFPFRSAITAFII